MYTRCPNCLTVFHLSAAHLARANGKVRCGRCNTVYNALAHLFDEPPATTGELPTTAAAATPVRAGTPVQSAPVAETVTASFADDSDRDDDKPVRQEPRFVDMDIDEPDWEPESGVDTKDDPADFADERAVTEEAAEDNAGETDDIEKEPVSETGGADSGHDENTGLPPFLDPAALSAVSAGPPPVRPTQWRWAVLGLLLALLLPAQHFYFKRDLYAADENMRPWLERLCALASCKLPLRRDPDRIDIINRKVVSHPGVRNALLINATFVNHADFVQAYPVLELLLSDSTGAPVAMRRFLPVEYLSDGVDIAAGIAPEVPVHLLLEVAEPSHTATSFQFEFL